MILREAARALRAALLTPDYVGALVAGLADYDAPQALRVLQGLARSLSFGNIAPFPLEEIPAYLRDREVPENEVALVGKVRVRTPRAPRTVSFTDAFLRFGSETGASVVPDMRYEDDPKAGVAVLAWLAGWKKLRREARWVWERAVKKVHLGRPAGTEDASWRPGGVLFLAVQRASTPASCSYYLAHELGHAFEEIHRIGGYEAPWGTPPFVSDYAESKPQVEDVAECFRAFVTEPAILRSRCPAKYEVIRALAR